MNQEQKWNSCLCCQAIYVPQLCEKCNEYKKKIYLSMLEEVEKLMTENNEHGFCLTKKEISPLIKQEREKARLSTLEEVEKMFKEEKGDWFTVPNIILRIEELKQ